MDNSTKYTFICRQAPVDHNDLFLDVQDIYWCDFLAKLFLLELKESGCNPIDLELFYSGTVSNARREVQVSNAMRDAMAKCSELIIFNNLDTDNVRKAIKIANELQIPIRRIVWSDEQMQEARDKFAFDYSEKLADERKLCDEADAHAKIASEERDRVRALYGVE